MIFAGHMEKNYYTSFLGSFGNILLIYWTFSLPRNIFTFFLQQW